MFGGEAAKMRMTSMVAGLAVILAACGGEKKLRSAGGGDSGHRGGSRGAGGRPSRAGKTHDVNMVLDGSKYKYDPDNLTIQSGDVVRYHNKSGGPHNVSFWPDSIPTGAADVLKKNMPNQMAPLEGPLLTEPDAVYKVSFAGAPKGDYKFYCLPHLALGMRGSSRSSRA